MPALANPITNTLPRTELVTRVVTDPASPAYQRPEAIEALPDLDLIRDLLAGTRRLHERAPLYIRKWESEAGDVYRLRSTCESLYEGFGRILSASVGMMFAKSPVMSYKTQGVQRLFEPQWANIDAAGTAGHVWVKRLAQWAMRDGLAVILVDHPPATGVVTLADEARMNLRPTWAMYQRRHVLSWRTETLDNADTVTMLTLAEPTSEPDGAFGIVIKQRVRELRIEDGRAVWRLWDVTDNPTIIEEGEYRDRRGRPFTTLPIAVAYAGDVEAPFVCRPPLMGVAWANIAHYQLSSELRFYTDLSSFPQPTVVGAFAADPATGQPQTLTLGPLTGVHLTEGSEFKWTEITGTAFDALAKRVQEKLEAMAALGLSFLSGDKRAQETAQARRMDSVAENSTLATAAQGIEDAINMALGHHAQYLGLTPDAAPVMDISTDYDESALDAQVMGAIAALVREGLPKIDAVRLLQAGGRLPSDRDPMEVAMEWEAGASGAAEVAAL